MHQASEVNGLPVWTNCSGHFGVVEHGQGVVTTYRKSFVTSRPGDPDGRHKAGCACRALTLRFSRAPGPRARRSKRDRTVRIVLRVDEDAASKRRMAKRRGRGAIQMGNRETEGALVLASGANQATPPPARRLWLKRRREPCTLRTGSFKQPHLIITSAHHVQDTPLAADGRPADRLSRTRGP